MPFPALLLSLIAVLVIVNRRRIMYSPKWRFWEET